MGVRRGALGVLSLSGKVCGGGLGVGLVLVCGLFFFFQAEDGIRDRFT